MSPPFSPRLVVSDVLKSVDVPWKMIPKLAGIAVATFWSPSERERATQGKGVAEEMSAWRKTRSGDELRTSHIYDAVCGEISALVASGDEDEHLAGLALKPEPETLLSLPGLLVGVVEKHLGSPERGDTANLCAKLSGELLSWLKPYLGDKAENLVRNLAEDLVAALLAEPSFSSQVEAAFRTQTQELLSNVVVRLAGLEGDLSSLVDAIAMVAGLPQEQHLDELCTLNRPLMRQAIFLQFRRQLCRPLRDDELGQLLESHGKTLDSEVIPQEFCYLPHTLTFHEGSPAALGESDTDWQEITIEKIEESFAQPGRQVMLVEGLAGFGKTTFLLHLALRLCEHPRLLPLIPMRLIGAEVDTLTPNLDGLVAWAEAKLQAPQNWKDEFHRAAVRALIERGRGVAFVDGLDQRPGAPECLVDDALLRTCPIHIVAACRQELHASQRQGWTGIVRLDALCEQDFKKVPEEQRKYLSNCKLSDQDARHPFFLHVVRILAFRKVLVRGGGSLPELFNLFVDELFAWGKSRTGKGETHTGIDKAYRNALGILGLSSLRFEQEDGARELQRLDQPVLEHVKELAAKALAAKHWNREKVDEIFDCAKDEVHILYILERLATSGQVLYIFHHQLVQEYLAACGLVDEIRACIGAADENDAINAAVQLLVKLVADVVQPRVLDSNTESEGERGDEIPERVPGLRFWSFVAEVLVSKTSPFGEAQRRELLQELTRVLWSHGGQNLGGACRSGLLRLRDEIIGCDKALHSRAKVYQVSEEAQRDLVWQQFSKGETDPFMTLEWERERQEIEKQLTALCPDGNWERLSPVETNRHGQQPSWRLAKVGCNVVGTDNDGHEWVLVPAGPFLAGGYEYADEMPVRTIETPAFWIARHVVTIRDFKDFIAADGYNETREWWAPFVNQLGFMKERGKPYNWEKHHQNSDYPVTSVSWFEAMAYCRWRSQQESGRCDGPYRLPTEAECEKAARGLFGRRWPWGCTWKPALIVCAEEGAAAQEKLAEVTANPNLSPFGAQGMAGNVWEWTSTKWQGTGFGEGLGVERKLKEVREGDAISLRGGSFFNDQDLTRCANRVRYDAGRYSDYFGFRCVRDVIPP